MITIDTKGDQPKGAKPMAEIAGLIRRFGVACEETKTLDFGDAVFEGRGPEGPIGIGIERKTLSDILQSIDDARLGGHQLVGMRHEYQVRVLLVEGHWKAHDPDGLLMESYNGINYGYARYRTQRVMYAKLYRYLISVSLSGVLVSHARDLWHTAYNICEYYHYFQKPWLAHTSLREIHKLAIPMLSGRPSLVRKWANAIDGVGVKHSEGATRVFKTPIQLATSDEMQWLRIPGVGIPTAQRIVQEIRGFR